KAEPGHPEDEPAQHFRRRRQSGISEQLRSACVFRELVELDEPQKDAQKRFYSVGDRPAHKCQDQHHDETRKEVSETSGNLVQRLTQFADNQFPHSCLTLLISTAAADTVSIARTQ